MWILCLEPLKFDPFVCGTVICEAFVWNLYTWHRYVWNTYLEPSSEIFRGSFVLYAESSVEHLYMWNLSVNVKPGNFGVWNLYLEICGNLVPGFGPAAPNHPEALLAGPKLFVRCLGKNLENGVS